MTARCHAVQDEVGRQGRTAARGFQAPLLPQRGMGMSR